MTKVKERVYICRGITSPLIDGQTRAITLVGVLTEETSSEEVTERTTTTVNGKRIYTSVSEDVEVYDAKFSMGLAVINPLDATIASPSDGFRIAKGRAVKPSKALTSLHTNDKFFANDTASAILNLQFNRIINNPDKFIKVSAKKSKA